MKIQGTLPTLVIEPGDPDEVIQAMNAWLSRHGIQITRLDLGLGTSIRRDVEGRRIGILCECDYCLPFGSCPWWFQLEAVPLPWPKIVLEMTS